MLTKASLRSYHTLIWGFPLCRPNFSWLIIEFSNIACYISKTSLCSYRPQLFTVKISARKVDIFPRNLVKNYLWSLWQFLELDRNWTVTVTGRFLCRIYPGNSDFYSGRMIIEEFRWCRPLFEIKSGFLILPQKLEECWIRFSLKLQWKALLIPSTSAVHFLS